MKKQKVVISKRNLLNINLKTISKTALLIPSTIFTAWEVSEYGVFSGPYSVQIPENKDQKKIRWKNVNRTFFNLCLVLLCSQKVLTD